MKETLHNFLKWWQDAPLYQSFWFIPFIAILYGFAVIKNFFTKEINK